MIAPGLDDRFYAELDARLGPSDERLLAQYPGGIGRRQLVHTAYVAALAYTADTAAAWGAEAPVLAPRTAYSRWRCQNRGGFGPAL